MLRLWQRLLIAVTTALMIGCGGGGGCGGCAGGGVTPLAGGFPVERRIENVASARLTETGLTFIEDNVGTLAALLLGDMGDGGVLTFDVPASTGDLILGISYELCPGGPDPMADPPTCRAEIDLANSDLSIDPIDPHVLRISGPINIRVQDLPLRVDYPLLPDGNVNVTINGDGACPGKDRPFADIPLQVDVSIEIDTDQSHARYGYSTVRIGEIQVDEDAVLNAIEYCNGGLTGSIIDLVDGLIIGQLVGGLTGTLSSAIEEQLCQPADPTLNPPCPTGTFNVDGICRYDQNADAECASIILGLDGNFDLGSLLSSISPGTKGAFNFLFAAGGDSLRDDMSGHYYGDLNPINNGVTLGLYGGFDPTPVSNCVTPVEAELPTDVPVPDELTANAVDNWPGDLDDPHFGLALSERFLNYALIQAYNSGALCLGVTAEALGPAVPLNTGLIGVGLGASSISDLGLQQRSQPMALMIRPNEPPVIDIGDGTNSETDPLLRLTWNQVSFDFFVWSLDRYVRAFTATLDIDVPLDLMVGPEGLQPVVANLFVANATVTNNTLVREDADKVAASLQDLLGSLVGGLLGDALPAIDINGLLGGLGLTLNIPPSSEGQPSPGLRRLVKDNDDFLGIFATLGLAEETMMATANGNQQSNALGPGPRFLRSRTTAELQWFDVDPEGLYLDSMTDDNGPRARILLGSDLDDGSRRIEWQYKVNRGPWRPFSEKRYVDIDDPILRLQGKHEIRIRSRVVGDAMSLDREPTVVTLVVDQEAPTVKILEHSDGRFEVKADDNVSGEAGTMVRVRYLIEGDWTEWSVWTPADELAIDNGDGIDELEVEARDEEGRIGTASSALIRGRGAADGGGCGCRLAETETAPKGGVWVALLGLIGLIVRRRRQRKVTLRQLRRGVQALCFVALGGLTGCSCGDDAATADTCATRGDCTGLNPGLIGSYSSAVVAGDGTVWVAGYLEADWEADWSYGDLVVGRYVDGAVDWKAVDGVPDEPAVDPQRYNPDGFRGGQTDPGVDVGLWTSIAIGQSGNPAVAYYDATNRALKYASYDGSTWQTTTVQTTELGHVGRYAKLRFVNGNPVIAYLFVEGSADGVVSGVRLASGSNGSASDASWTFEDVATNPTSPCDPALCPSGYVCTEDFVCLEDSRDCAEDCGDGECVLEGGSPVCKAEAGAANTYPDAYGLYVAMDTLPSGGLGIAFYDRTGGNVVTAVQQDGAWATTIVDGAAGGTDTGDKGIGLSLDIDEAGNFHLAYVDGLDEGVNYVMVQGGTTVSGSPELVDDGRGIGDGVHIVGDDSSIAVTPSGEVQISYQDASGGTLRYAVGTPNASGHDWTTKSVEQEGFAGHFSQILDVDGTRQVMNWYRVASPSSMGDVRLVTP